MTRRRSSMWILAAAIAAIVPATLAGADEEKVMVSRPGTVFHKVNAADLRGRGVEKTLGSAMDAGYRPCPVCFAPTASSTKAAPAGGAVAAATGRGNGNGNANGQTPPASGQPIGTQLGTLERRYLDKAVRDPYAALDTITMPAREQGAYGDDLKGAPGGH